MKKLSDKQKERVIKKVIEHRYGKVKRGARYSKRNLLMVDPKAAEEAKGEKINDKENNGK